MRKVNLSVVFLMRPLAAIPGGRAAAATVIAASLLGLFWGTGVFEAYLLGTHSVGGRAGSAGAALFFSVFLAYVIPIFGYISERTVAALQQLRDFLEVDAQQFQRWQAGIHEKPLGWLAIVLLVGASSGFAHNLLLFGSPVALYRLAAESTAVTAVVVGTQLTWMIVSLAVAALIDNAIMLNRAARHSRVQPFSPEHLRPFATIAVISTLALIGAQAVFPLMFLDAEISAVAYIPGMLATGIPMVLLAALPVWPVHQRIAAIKQRLLAEVDAHIATEPLPSADRPEHLQRLAQLLAYRREIRAISEWPFDTAVMARLAFYLIIPPLTWVGAALVENLVEAFL